MTCKYALELEWLCFGCGLAGNGDHGVEILDFPDLGCVVGATGCEVLDVGGEQDAGDVLAMCFEVSDGHELGLFTVLQEVPDVYTAL